MKYLLFILALCSTSAFAASPEQEFRQSFAALYGFCQRNVPELFRVIDESRLLGALARARIEVTDEKIYIEVSGVRQESVAENYPERRLVRINRARWQAMTDTHLR